jgi:hypothetical protein
MIGEQAAVLTFSKFLKRYTNQPFSFFGYDNKRIVLIFNSTVHSYTCENGIIRGEEV